MDHDSVNEIAEGRGLRKFTANYFLSCIRTPYSLATICRTTLGPADEKKDGKHKKEREKLKAK